MIKCPNCGAEAQEGKFCEKCGSPLPSVQNGADNDVAMGANGNACPNCGYPSSGGKFCEKCGTPLPGAAQRSAQAPANDNVCPNCGYPSSGGKFCEKCGSPLPGGSAPMQFVPKKGGILDNISNSINNTTSNLLSIKSDYNNNVVIYRVNKIPSVKEKTIRVLDHEMAYFNQGNGFVKYNQTFKTDLNSFICFFVQNTTYVNNSFVVNLETKIQKLDTDDKVKIAVNFLMTLEVEDKDKFINTFTNIRQDSWREVDINAYLSTNLRSIIDKNVEDMLKQDGDLDLRDPKAQVNKFVDEIKKLIEDNVKEYGFKVNSFGVSGVSLDVNEVNKILVNHLYKGE